MIQIAVRVRELVSSNVDNMVEKATDPSKMLGLLRSEIEESLLGLHKDLSAAKRKQAHCESHAQMLITQSEEWTGKAKIAVDHGREDLARAALLARESGIKEAESAKAEAQGLAGKITDLESAITNLEAKREDVLSRLAGQAPAAATQNPSAAAAVSDSKIAQRLDRIDEIERRVAFQSDGESEPAPADVDAEIASLTEAKKIDAELAAMKGASKKSPRKKAK